MSKFDVKHRHSAEQRAELPSIGVDYFGSLIPRGVVRMVRKMLMAVAILVALVALTFAAQRGEEPKAGSGAEPDFTGKVLMVNVKEPARGGVLQKAKVQRLGGRPFLVGQYVKRSNDDPHPEETLWFPVDDIILIREFTSVDDVLKVYQAFEK